MIYLNRFLTILLFGGLVYTATAQLPSSMTGTWKRTGMTSTDLSGKTSDDFQEHIKVMPCTKNITYTFKADGSFLTTVPDECGAMKKTIEATNGAGKCTAFGNKVKVTMKGIPDATYDVKVAGNTMTWVFDYASNPKEHNIAGSKLKSLTIVYTKI